MNQINNDLVKFIEYLYDLKKKNKKDLQLWNEIDKRIFLNKEVNEQKIEQLLQAVPLYFLLNVLVYASYKEDIKTIIIFYTRTSFFAFLHEINNIVSNHLLHTLAYAHR